MIRALATILCLALAFGCTEDRAVLADAVEPMDTASEGDALDARDVDGDGARSSPCRIFGMGDPRHTFRWVRVETLAPDRAIDSVEVHLGGMAECAYAAESVESGGTYDWLDMIDVIGPSDAVSDDGATCDSSLASALPNVGDSVVVFIGGPAPREGGVIEVRDAAACTEASDQPTFRVWLGDWYWGEPGAHWGVVGDGTGPVARIVVPEGFYEGVLSQ